MVVATPGAKGTKVGPRALARTLSSAIPALICRLLLQEGASCSTRRVPHLEVQGAIMIAPKMQISSPPPLQVTVGTPGLEDKRLEFTELFRIGRTEECEVCVQDEHVSRIHAEVSFENGTWWIRDLGSTNGLYSLGQPFEQTSIAESMTIRLGIEGPEVRFKVGQPARKDEGRSPDGDVIARYVEHYFGNSNEPVGKNRNGRRPC